MTLQSTKPLRIGPAALVGSVALPPTTLHGFILLTAAYHGDRFRRRESWELTPLSLIYSWLLICLLR
jgi:hypothetical protein